MKFVAFLILNKEIILEKNSQDRAFIKLAEYIGTSKSIE